MLQNVSRNNSQWVVTQRDISSFSAILIHDYSQQHKYV